ncbi:hypothetical protein QFZ34_003934 [Phyllobacterium ifriqiyense]|uniref:Uncharacterized protein n=1 Tax=Phyllobacterium ifriqiyense TaxID=314238 RepID=A0ABU0SDG2_9HYPH|nr:hypothetical protein [Phyllobacterium ifriqiyense]
MDDVVQDKGRAGSLGIWSKNEPQFWGYAIVAILLKLFQTAGRKHEQASRISKARAKNR